MKNPVYSSSTALIRKEYIDAGVAISDFVNNSSQLGFLSAADQKEKKENPKNIWEIPQKALEQFQIKLYNGN